jgi:hypothetical protein
MPKPTRPINVRTPPRPLMLCQFPFTDSTLSRQTTLPPTIPTLPTEFLPIHQGLDQSAREASFIDHRTISRHDEVTSTHAFPDLNFNM